MREDKAAKRLQAIAGVGTITADAVSASVGNAHDFKNGRQFQQGRLWNAACACNAESY